MRSKLSNFNDGLYRVWHRVKKYAFCQFFHSKDCRYVKAITGKHVGKTDWHCKRCDKWMDGLRYKMWD